MSSDMVQFVGGPLDGQFTQWTTSIHYAVPDSAGGTHMYEMRCHATSEDGLEFTRSYTFEYAGMEDTQ